MSSFPVNLTEAEFDDFPSLDTLGVLVQVSFSTGFLLGLPVNSYAIWLITARPESRVASEFFNLNVLICEIGSCLNYLLCLLSVWFLPLSKPAFFFWGLAFTGRPLFQCLMCVERYVGVVHPVTFLKYRSLRYRIVCSVVAWMITLASCVFSYISSISRSTLYFWFFLVQIILLLLIQLSCMLAVLIALKRSGPGDRKKEENNMKRRAFHLILITTVSMLIAYSPYSVLAYFAIFTTVFLRALYYLGYICITLACFIQPLLYLHRVGKICCS